MSSFVCEGCGETFTPPPRGKRERRFCSRECYRSNSGGEKHSCFQKDAVNCVCMQCNSKFRVTKSLEHKLFCSSSCWRDHQKENPKNGIGQCPNCGENFKRLKAGQACCSSDCQHRFFVGEDSKNWKGGEYQGCDDVVRIHTGKLRDSGKSAGQDIYARKHRVIVEEAIGRELFEDERIWHIDRDHGNNSLRNLYIFKSQSEMCRAINSKQLPTTSNITSIDG